MPQKLSVRAKVVVSTLAGFTPAQKVLAVLALAVLVLGGTAFSRWVATPTYAPLFANLAPEDASAITELLTASGTQFQLEDGGTTILVPREAVNAQRLAAAAAGLPDDTETGYALLDAEGVTSSQFQQQITYQRALEGELAATIKGIEGVRTAVVHLAIPEETVFTDEAVPPTASVLVDPRPGASLSGDQVQSIVHLVSSSVPELEADQVTVSSSDGTLLSAAGQGVSAAGGRDGATTEYEQRTEAALQAMLDTVVGPGKAVATVTAELDFDQTQRTTEEFTSEDGVPPLSETESTEEYTGTGGIGVGGALGDNGVLGMDGQELGAGATAGDSGYTKTSATRNNAVNKTTEQTTEAPGTLRRQSIAVVVDSEAAATATVPQLTQMVTAAAGVDAARGDTLAVSQVPFDTSISDAAAEELAAARAAEAAEERNALILQAAVGALVLLLALVAGVLWRRAAKRRARQVVDLGELEAMYRRDDVITEDGEALGSGATIALPGTEAAGPQLTPVGPSAAALRRAEVGDLVDAQPAEVAEVLRGWLSEKGK